MVEIRHLRYFIAVAQESNFSRAAEKLHISQPPLSQQIQKLEEDLGLMLIERGTRPVMLTEAGKFFYQQALGLVDQFDQFIDKTQKMARGEEGALTIAFVSSSTYELMPGILRNFRKLYPGVSLNLIEMNTPQQLESLKNKQINVGIGRPFPENPEIESHWILDESVVVAIPSEHVWTNKTSVSLTDLKDEDMINFYWSHEPSFGNFVMTTCRKAGFEPHVVQRTGELQTALGLVAAGIGVALLPESVEHTSREGVKYIPLRTPSPTISMVAAYRKDDSSPILKRFLDVVRSGKY
ncbi:MAG: LysR family transcriptional regulator [Candidatus Melainabacteria bacterium]|nr:LysR family transcriptional regulator [Candidatus Melainabacteria bacterium]